jgi:hypothetical protein
MSIDVKAMMNRVKQMTYHEVTIELYEPLHFDGSPAPFDMTIKGDMLTANILAESYDKAEQVLHDYVRRNDVL